MEKSTNDNRPMMTVHSGDERPPKEAKNQSFGSFTPRLALATFAAAISGNFIDYYGLVPLNKADWFKQQLNDSLIRHGSDTSLRSLATAWSVTFFVFFCSAAMGALTFCFIADRVGRRNGLFVCQIGSLSSCAFWSVAMQTNMLEMMMIGHVLAGWSAGACAGLVPLYVAEISPVNLRGATACLSQLISVSGAVIGLILRSEAMFGAARYWPVLLALSSVPNVVSFVLLPFCPESPGYLLVRRREFKAAESSLRKLRQKPSVTRELAETEREEKLLGDSEAACSFHRLFFTKRLRLPLALVCAASATQQTTGIQVLLIFSPLIFSQTAAAVARHVPLIAAVCLTVTTGAMVLTVQRVNRRPLMLFSTCLTGLFCVFFAFNIALDDAVSWMPQLCIVSVVLLSMAFCLGLAFIPPLLGAELFPLGSRAAALSVAALVRWICAFSSLFTFPFMHAAFGGYCFLIFATVGAFSFLFLLFKLPETKNKSLSEVYEQLGAFQSVN